MSAGETTPACRWLNTGDEAFEAMLAAIDAAQRSVCLETYIFSAGSPGERFRGALIRARQRGAQVRVLIDALGSIGLPDSFWEPLRRAGGEVRVFNPLALQRVSIRDHRKLLVCDNRVAFIGGFNLAPEYEGDGITRGWRDLGLSLEGPLVQQLVVAFDAMFARADFCHKRFARLRQTSEKRSVSSPNEQIFFSGPGRGQNPIQRALQQDLAAARDVKIVVAYFLPTRRLRRDLLNVVRRGGQVQLILAGKSDVFLSQLAGRSLYRRFLRAGVDIFEYQPQILHAKLMIVDDAVYVGSSNLDQRSLRINYELMVRLEGNEMATQARAGFARTLEHCRPVTREAWHESQTFWQSLQQRWAHFLLVQIDPWIARHQWRALPD